MSKLRMDRERPIAQTVRPIRAALVAGTSFPVCPNCEGGSPFPGEDSAAAAAGTFAVSTAGDKKGREETAPKKENGRGFFLLHGIAPLRGSDSILLHRSAALRRTDITVSVKLFTCADYPSPAGVGDMHS